MSLADFKNLHEHEDVYVLGSGATLDHIDPEFFRDKVVVATNGVADRLGLYDVTTNLYVVTHYHQDAKYLSEKYPFFDVLTPLGDQGFAGTPQVSFDDNVTTYPNKVTSFDFNVDKMWPDDPDSELIVGSTSMHAAMHFACLLGASTVLMCGADCGLLDGAANHTGYQSGNLAGPVQDQVEWLARWELHLRKVSAKLRTHYGVRIYSITPWQNLQLEGHVYQGFVLGEKE